MRLSGTLLLAALFGALAVASTGAAAEPQRAFFDVRVSGTITKQWRYVEYNPDTECAVRRSYRGREAFTFRSRRATRVLVRSRADGNLLLGAMLRNVAGTYEQAGTRSDRSTSASCPNPVSYSTRCAPPLRSTTRGGTIGLAAPRKGLLQLRKLRLPIRVPRALSACEPRAVAALPTRAEVASARALADDLFDPRARAVELEGSATETTMFSGGDTGRAVVAVRWTVSFEPSG